MMFEKISKSWELVKASVRVLSADKELIVFPILSTIGVLIVSALFIFPFIIGNVMDVVVGKDKWVFEFLILFLWYVVQYFVIYFANTALVGAALIRLRGGDPTVKDGLRIALSRFAPILGYSLVAATVGILLHALSRKRGGWGRLVSSVVGMAWNIATYLVVPVLAVEGIGPFSAIKRSMVLLKKTWGEQITGELGMSAVFSLVYGIEFLAALLSAFLVLSTIPQATGLLIAIGVLFVLALVITFLVSSTLSSIYAAAVYQFAAEGQTGSFFDAAQVQNAFKAA